MVNGVAALAGATPFTIATPGLANRYNPAAKQAVDADAGDRPGADVRRHVLATEDHVFLLFSSIGSLAGDGKCCREERRAGSSALQWPGLPESLHRVVPAGCDTPHEVELPETSCGLPVAFAELLAGHARIEIGTAMHLRQTRRGATMVIGTLGAMNARVCRPAKSRTRSTSCSNRTLHDRDFGLRTLEVYCCGQEMLLYQRFSSLGGTGSYPPWVQGWQRRILVNPIQPPRSAP